MTQQWILEQFERLKNPAAIAGQRRYGITATNGYGLTLPLIRGLARDIGRDHPLAIKIWGTEIHDARLLAPMIADPRLMTSEQMNSWVTGFDSWDVCDQCCSNLFCKTPCAVEKVFEWSGRNEEFVKRAAFALIAANSVHQKKMSDDVFLSFLPLIERESVDERNFVKKAVNWALRQIGKRNRNLHSEAVDCANRLLELPSRSARWIARDALAEFGKEIVQARFRRQEEQAFRTVTRTIR